MKNVVVNGSHIKDVEHGIVVRFSRVVTVPMWIEGREVAVYIGHTVFQPPSAVLQTDEGVVNAGPKLIAQAVEDANG